MIKIYQDFLLNNGLKFMINLKKNCNVNKETTIKTAMPRSDLRAFSDAYIVVKGVIPVTNADEAKGKIAVEFKINAPFINCISKINGVQIENAEDLDVVMPMYSLLEYSKNYRKTTGMNQVILFVVVLNLLTTRQVLQEILITSMMVKLVMVQTKLTKMKLKLF